MHFNVILTLSRTLYAPILTFDFFGEFDPVRVCEGAWLLVDVVNVQHFAHELDDWLSLVEGGGGHCRKKDKKIISYTKI